jgi:hypothetical protein
MTTQRSASGRRVKLGVQALEAHDVPASTTTFDLTFPGAQVTANSAILTQTASVSSDQFQTFVALQNSGTEEGYNTDARPFDLDQTGDLTVTHALLLADIPIVNIGGVDYRQFYLDVNELSASPQVSSTKPQVLLDELRIYLAETPDLTGYNSHTQTLSGLGAAWDLDGGGNVSVKLDASLNPTGVGDAFVYIPSAFFGSSTYVYLYSKFGGKVKSDGGQESWGILPVNAGGGTASISGVVYAEINQVPGFDDVTFPPDQLVSGVTVRLERFNGTGWVLVGEQTTGSFSFEGLTAGTYRLTKLNDFNQAKAYDGLNFVGSAGGTDTNPFTQIDSGWSSIDQIDQIIIGDGVAATGYNFELVPINSPG